MNQVGATLTAAQRQLRADLARGYNPKAGSVELAARIKAHDEKGNAR